MTNALSAAGAMPALVAEKAAGAMVTLTGFGRLSRCVRQCAAQRSGDGETSQLGDGREALGVTVAPFPPRRAKLTSRRVSAGASQGSLRGLVAAAQM